MAPPVAQVKNLGTVLNSSWSLTSQMYSTSMPLSPLQFHSCRSSSLPLVWHLHCQNCSPALIRPYLDLTSCLGPTLSLCTGHTVANHIASTCPLLPPLRFFAGSPFSSVKSKLLCLTKALMTYVYDLPNVRSPSSPHPSLLLTTPNNLLSS